MNSSFKDKNLYIRSEFIFVKDKLIEMGMATGEVWDDASYPKPVPNFYKGFQTAAGRVGIPIPVCKSYLESRS